MLRPVTSTVRGRAGRLVTPDGVAGLHLLVQQLWAPLVATGDYRVMVNADLDAGWDVRQRFWIVPSARNPRLLVSTGVLRGTARSLTAYRGIRDSIPSLGRVAMAGMLSAGLPVSKDQLTVERRVDAGKADAEPLATMNTVLDAELVSIIGVRTGANAKATLQLFTTEGTSAGYAKIAWNDLTTTFVLQETNTLLALQGKAGRVRVPRVLAHGTAGPFPFLVTSPLPPDVASVRGDLSLAELADVAPLQRHDVVAHTRQFKDLESSIHVLLGQSIFPSLTEPAMQLLQLLRSGQHRVPIAERWHGDLVPWNAAREPDGTLWLWDWEMSQADAAVGLDALHWYVNAGAGSEPTKLVASLISAGQNGTARLRALGLGRPQMETVAALYALTLAERSMNFAMQHHGWHLNRLQSSIVVELLRAGQVLASHSTGSRT